MTRDRKDAEETLALAADPEYASHPLLLGLAENLRASLDREDKIVEILAPLVGLLRRATKGPWKWAHHGTWEVEAGPNQLVADCGSVARAEGDARLIAAALNAITGMLSVIEISKEREGQHHDLRFPRLLSQRDDDPLDRGRLAAAPRVHRKDLDREAPSTPVKLGSLKKDPETEFFYCEGVAASGRSRWHLRPVGPKGLMLGGGIDTPSLCGHLDPQKPFGGGWDIQWREKIVGQDLSSEITCPRCLIAYKDHVRNSL